MRRAVLITRQAISPRFAISIVLNMLLVIDLWLSNLGGGFLPGNLVRLGRASQLRLQQIGPLTTAYWSDRETTPDLSGPLSRNSSEITRGCRRWRSPSPARRPT